MTKRTFIAIKIKADNNFKNIYRTIKSDFYGDRIKWVDIDNIHITLKFTGETQIEKIENINEILEEIINNYSPFKIRIKNFGVFASLKNPFVFWFGLEKTDKLREIRSKIDLGLSEIGFRTEKRDFNPHLTIARPKFIKNTDKILSLSESLRGQIIQEIKVDEIIFYESILKKNGAVYNPIKNYKLTK